MKDPIERQDAIDAVKTYLTDCQVEDADWHGNGIEHELNNLPSAQPEQRWIPVGERLPKPFEYCLWTTTDGRVVYHHCDGLFSKYTAWMPLPEPYKERREE